MQVGQPHSNVLRTLLHTTVCSSASNTNYHWKLVTLCEDKLGHCGRGRCHTAITFAAQQRHWYVITL